MRPYLSIAPLLLAGALVAACGGDDFDELTEDATGQASEIRGEVEDLTNDLESQIEGADLGELDDEARGAIENNCLQLAEEAADTSLENEVTDLCGDIRQALTEGSQTALDEAGDRLSELVE